MPAASASDLVAGRREFQTALLEWFAVHQRALPWRQEPSLYKTVVSEFMLQQTQVKTVLPYFARWVEEWPDFASLAAAEEAQVLRLWEGLGYYSRARNLHRLAQAVTALPAPPATPDQWLDLPGIGPYTAAAITSIALHYPAACVDGNVVRILARLTADATPFRDSASAARALSPLADSLLTRNDPGAHNQAMMELGATVCVRRAPLCPICPVRVHCAAAARGEPEAFPQLAPKVMEKVSITRLWCENNGHLLLHRAASDARRFAGMHELPQPAHLGWEESDVTDAPVLATHRRGITRYAITESIRRLDHVDQKRVPPSDSLVWVKIDELDALVLSGPHRRWINALLAAPRATA